MSKINKIEYKNGLEFIPSTHQIEIFNHIERGVGNLVINAGAGAGKSSTLVNAIKLIPTTNKILFIAFNKEIVKELKKRIGEQSNIDIMTCHSLGFSILRQNNREINYDKPNDYKYRNHIKGFIGDYTTTNEMMLGKVKYNTYINNITELVNLSRYNLAQSPKEIEVIAKRYGVLLIDDECKVVSKVLVWGSENVDIIDYTDMIWLPIELTMNPHKHKYDWVFVDEFQDISTSQKQLIFKCFKRGTRFCVVGDVHQNINSWCGASSDIFLNMCKTPNTRVFDLPVSYRCPNKIIEMAREYSPNIEAAPNAIDGEVLYDLKVSIPQSGDMVLCRTTSPLIRLYMTYLRMNKKAYIRGKNIGRGLINDILETNQLLLNKSLVNDGVFVRLYDKLFELRNLLMRRDGLDKADATMSPWVMDLYDSIKALTVLSEGAETADDLTNKIDDIFLDLDGEGICLSTIHKAKGLEADNVYIICRSLMPNILAKEPWELETENNIIYVAITRAKKRLGYISEEEFPSQTGFFNHDTTMKDLNIIELKVSDILGKSYVVEGFEEEFVRDSNKYSKMVEQAQTITQEDIRSGDSDKLKKINKRMSRFL